MEVGGCLLGGMFLIIVLAIVIPLLVSQANEAAERDKVARLAQAQEELDENGWNIVSQFRAFLAAGDRSQLAKARAVIFQGEDASPVFVDWLLRNEPALFVDLFSTDTQAAHDGLAILEWALGQERSAPRIMVEAELYTVLGDVESLGRIMLPIIDSRSSALRPVRHIFQYRYAECLLACGHRSDALRHFKGVARKFPGYSHVDKYIAELRQKTRKAADRASENDEAHSSSRAEAAAAPDFDILGAAYRLLGVGPASTRQEVVQAYRGLITKYHPDKVASLGDELNQLALAKTKQINDAYNLILRSFPDTSDSEPESVSKRRTGSET